MNDQSQSLSPNDDGRTVTAPRDAVRMRMRYGFNEINGWWHMSLGPHAGEIQRRLKLMDTRVVRIFVFDQPVPSPVSDWGNFAAHIQSILDVGAVPMVTFARFGPPFDDPILHRRFVEQCRDVVWGCLEVWGGAQVRDWYWCIWNEPNNRIIGGGLTFEEYAPVYLDVASAVHELLAPHLDGAKARIGGPSIDGTYRPYWMDWISRLLDQVDDHLIGFVNWHKYGDWRPAVPSHTLGLEMWGSPDAPDGAPFETLLMAQTPSYEARARGVARLLAGREIENICGELNTIAHHENYYTLGLNQNVFGAAYYASALIHLIRGGADLEMRWTASGHEDAYGLLSLRGEPTPAALAKQLFAQHVRRDDLVWFPAHRREAPGIDSIVALGEEGRLSGVFVNTGSAPVAVTPGDWERQLSNCGDVLRLDVETGGRIVREEAGRQVRIGKHGIAVVTNAADATSID